MSLRFDKLGLGDMIEVGPLMGNLSRESTVILITDTSPEKVVGQVTYYGVHVAEAEGTPTESGGVEWTFL